MKVFLNLLILLVIISDRYNYYIRERTHIIQYIHEINKGEIVIYLYDSIIVGVGLFGVLIDLIILPFIVLSLEVLIKIYALQHKGLKYLKDEYQEMFEGQIFFSLLIIFLHIFYFLLKNSKRNKDRLEVIVEHAMKRRSYSPQRRRLDSRF